MKVELTMQPMGPQKIRERMAELQGILGQPTGAPSAMASFDNALEAAMPFAETTSPSPLSGQIGGSLAPMNPFGQGANVEGKPSPEHLKPMIEKAALDNNLDPALLDALVLAESGYDSTARSRAGAMGLTQLMPDTAAGLGVKNPFDPAQNLEGGAKYLSQMLERFKDLPTALAAYNAGPGAVEKAGGIPNYEETKKYVEKVLNLYRARRGG